MIIVASLSLTAPRPPAAAAVAFDVAAADPLAVAGRDDAGGEVGTMP
jgi:hypothetical protein